MSQGGPAQTVTTQLRTIPTCTNTLSHVMSNTPATTVLSALNSAQLVTPSEITKLAFTEIRLCFAGPDEHEEIVMSKMINLGPGLGYKCSDCDYNSAVKSNMRHHVESTHLDLTYQCNLCPKSLKSYKSWFMHMQRAHKNRNAEGFQTKSINLF